ncbi:Transcriptional activator [Apophysomyces sp. BC1034]|nr:Transcriptional activator [Apophysomyces sp. BC1015]KAG0181865.1 Transcriptional activator [Apophysomyces sp. BC1021]KAG0192661.1 Transcriptional activator [Apophysomyces sp. BC1034]
MSSVFVPENSGSNQSQQQKPPEPTRPKRPRSSLACIRCRKKKVKCDFVQPTCGRCAIAGLPCSYATPPRRVDGHAFDQLGNHVEELKERMQKMQSELAMMKNNLHPFSGNLGFRAGDDDNSSSGATTPFSMSQGPVDQLAPKGAVAVIESQHLQQPQSQQPVTWKLSLSQSGLRIDTNIASVADLYRILLNGISQLNINSDSAANLYSTESIRGDGNKSKQNRGLNRYLGGKNALEPNGQIVGADADMGIAPAQTGGGGGGSGGRLWEVDDNEARKILQERKQSDDTLPQETLDRLMHTCYHKCFLAYQIVDKEAFMQQYSDESGLEPLLANSINAWISKHGCIYHNACPGQDPSAMGEAYFKNARQLLKKCFDISSPTTIHALLNLYMYQLSSERSNLAYLYIGLAIRMAQDLKFHKKDHMPVDMKQRETNKRLWWSAYWLDLCAALESNRPTMVDDKDCDLEYPTKLDSEDEETGYRISFCVHSIKLMKIRKDITKHLPSEQSGQSLLSAISRLENALTNWLNELPQDLHFEQDDTFQCTKSFRDEACLILNIQYQTTWVMLHKFFLPKQDQTATPVALLSLNICTKSANFITKMLDIYAKNLSWCQFFYALDGVIASVTIHQVNALSSEKEVAHLAQRNLIVTANVLKKSPLVYMEKVNEIIESIEGFLKKNGLPTDLSELPPINEDSANQQSISSVFHPTVFESPSSQHQTSAFGSSNFGSTTPLSQHRADPDSPSISASRFGSVGPMPRSSPRPPASGTVRHGSVPSQMSPHQSVFSGQSSASPIAMVHSPQRPVPELSKTPQVPSRPPQHQHQQQQPLPYGTSQLQHPNTNVMVEPDMLFSDPALIGFNMSNNSVSGAMDNLLFRNMGFDMNNANMAGERMPSAEAAFGHQGMLGSLDTPMFNGRGAVNTTSFQTSGLQGFASNTHNHSTSFPFGDMAQGTEVPMYGQQGNTTEDPSYPNFLPNSDLYGLSHGDGQPHEPQQQPPQTILSQYQLNSSTTAAPQVAGGTAFDPNALFGQMNMDPATMNALLQYSTPSDGYGHFQYANQSQAPQQPGTAGSQYADSDLTAAMFAASSRKRVHREWDESA